MKKLALILATLLAGCASRYGVVVKTTDASPQITPSTGKVCLLAGSLPAGLSYTQLGTISATKRSYGGTDEIMRAMADEARRLGADAVVNMAAEQRFKGPLPWRMVAPTGEGRAVKASAAFDCEASGGTLM